MQDRPTGAELEVLAIFWEIGTASVRQVHERLAREKETGYTTTLKTMQNMHSKGLLTRDEKKRSHLYQARVSQQDTQKSLVKRFYTEGFWWIYQPAVPASVGANPALPGGNRRNTRVFRYNRKQKVTNSHWFPLSVSEVAAYRREIQKG